MRHKWLLCPFSGHDSYIADGNVSLEGLSLSWKRPRFSNRSKLYISGDFHQGRMREKKKESWQEGDVRVLEDKWSSPNAIADGAMCLEGLCLKFEKKQNLDSAIVPYIVCAWNFRGNSN